MIEDTIPITIFIRIVQYLFGRSTESIRYSTVVYRLAGTIKEFATITMDDTYLLLVLMYLSSTTTTSSSSLRWNG